MFESIILNIITVALTSWIAPALVRWRVGRALSKGVAIGILILNAFVMILGWVALRGQLLTGDFSTPPPGGNYIPYGVALAIFTSWNFLTSKTAGVAPVQSDTQQPTTMSDPSSTPPRQSE